jgi:enoyl reductase-like protein
LWAAEDIEAVFDQDPQRVCILQGPVAVKHSKVKDEPIKSLLGNVVSYLVEQVLNHYYAGDKSAIPTVEYLSVIPPSISQMPAICSVRCEVGDGQKSFMIGDNIPDASTWLETLAGPELNWLRALLTSRTIVQGKSYIDNPIRRLLVPRPSQRVVVQHAHSYPTAIAFYGAARNHGQHKADIKAVDIRYDSSTKLIYLTVYEERRNVAVPLRLQFRYVPSMPFAAIHEIAENRNTRIKEFYWKLWYGDEASLPALGLRDVFTGPEVTIDEDAVQTFCSVVGNRAEAFKTARNEVIEAPVDFAIVTGWQVRAFHS